jgi:hypothetical protein
MDDWASPAPRFRPSESMGALRPIYTRTIAPDFVASKACQSLQERKVRPGSPQNTTVQRSISKSNASRIMMSV